MLTKISKLEVEGKFLNLMNVIYRKPASNNLVTSESSNSTVLSSSSSHVLSGLGSPTRNSVLPREILSPLDPFKLVTMPLQPLRSPEMQVELGGLGGEGIVVFSNFIVCVFSPRIMHALKDQKQ